MGDPVAAEEKDLWNRRAVLVNTVLFALKLLTGIFTMSMAVLSDAVDSGIDVATSAMAMHSVRIAGMPADERHRYGHGKYENLSGLVQALVIMIIALALAAESLRRLISGPEVELAQYGALIMVVSIAGKYMVASNMHRVARKHDSIAMEANALNLRADIWLSAGVLLSLGLIYLLAPGWPDIVYLDPLLAIIIAMLIFREGVRIARRTSADLLDESIPQEEQALVEEVLARHRGDYLEYHRLRARKSGSQRQLDMHLVVPRDMGLERAHQLTDIIEKEIAEKLGDTTVVIHVEPCDGECGDCSRHAGG